MEQPDKPPTPRRRHLLTDEQLAPHPEAEAQGSPGAHRDGNGIRVHRTYIIVVSLAALFLLGVGIVLAGTTM